MRIVIEAQKLTDGSKVFNVTIADGDAMRAVTEDDAIDFAECLADAVKRYTLDPVCIRYDY